MYIPSCDFKQYCIYVNYQVMDKKVFNPSYPMDRASKLQHTTTKIVVGVMAIGDNKCPAYLPQVIIRVRKRSNIPQVRMRVHLDKTKRSNIPPRVVVRVQLDDVEKKEAPAHRAAALPEFVEIAEALVEEEKKDDCQQPHLGHVGRRVEVQVLVANITRIFIRPSINK